MLFAWLHVWQSINGVCWTNYVDSERPELRKKTGCREWEAMEAFVLLMALLWGTSFVLGAMGYVRGRKQGKGVASGAV